MATDNKTVASPYYCIRRNCDPDEGAWWIGGGWGRKAERAYFGSLKTAQEEVGEYLSSQSGVEIVCDPQEGPLCNNSRRKATMTVTQDNLDSIRSLSLRREADSALEAGDAPEYRLVVDIGDDGYQTGTATEYLYLPDPGRGGVCEGGDPEWTDADDMDDLIDRWANYETHWSN